MPAMYNDATPTPAASGLDFVSPNIYGKAPTFTQQEGQEIKAILADPLIQRFIHYHLHHEYALFIDRNPLKQSADDLRAYYAYLAGMYALATNLIAVPNLPQE